MTAASKEPRRFAGTLSDQIHTAIRADISEGRLAPGERLVESEIARKIGVSQAPVREALKRLAHEGLVLQLPRRGTYVAEISEEEARRSYLVREPLEDVAAREYCAHAPDSAHAQLQECIDRMFDAAKRDDLAQLVQADIDFHRTVWEASGNPALPRIWPIVESMMRSFTAVSNKVYFRKQEVAASHLPLLETLRDRDPDRAATAAREHINLVWKRVAGANLDQVGGES